MEKKKLLGWMLIIAAVILFFTAPTIFCKKACVLSTCDYGYGCMKIVIISALLIIIAGLILVRRKSNKNLKINSRAEKRR